MDVLDLVKLALVARLLIIGTQALGSTAAVDSELLDSAKGSERLPCFDWEGKLIEDGKQYIPEKQDPCMKCTCSEGKRTLCAAVRCSPPTCPMWEQLSGECCQFHCINLPQEPGMNNKNSTTFIRDPPGNAPPSNANDDTTNLGLRLVASTVTSFLILALLLFMIHRLRRRRMLLMMRRLSSNNRRENGSDVVAAAYVSEYDDINIGVEIPPYEDPPPPYSPPRPPRNLPMEAPPPYDTMPRASPGDVSEVGFRNVQSQTQDTMMRTSVSHMRILDHGNSLNDNAHLGQVDNNNVHGAHDMNQNPIADFNQNRITNINTTNGATPRSQLVRLPETGMNVEFERLRRTSAPRSHRDEHNYENLDILRGIQEPMYENVETMRHSLLPDDIDHDRSHRERHSCYIDRDRGRVLYERTRASSSDTESNHSRRGGYETLDNPMSTDSSRASSTHHSFCFPRSADVSPNLKSADISPHPSAGDGIEDGHEVTRRRPGDPRTSFLKKSGEMEVRRLRDSPRNSFCLDDNIDLDEVDLRPMNTSISSTLPADRRSDRHSDSLDCGHRRPCYQSGSRSSKIVLEDSEDRKIVCYSQDGATAVSERAVQTECEPVFPEDTKHHYLTVPAKVATPKVETPKQTCAPQRFRISKFLDALPSNHRHSTYAAQPPLSNQNGSPGLHRRSLPPMSLSLGLPETPPCAGYQPEPYRTEHHNSMKKDDQPEHGYNYQNKLTRLRPDQPFSPDVYPGATHFSSPLTPVQSSTCNSPNRYSRGETPTRSPITPGTPLHPLQRSGSLLSQASFLSVCSETGEQRKRKHPTRHHGSLSPTGSRNSLLACSRGNPRKYPSMGSVLPPPLLCQCDEESVENFQNCRLHHSDRHKGESSYSVHSCPEELPKEEILPTSAHGYGGARPKLSHNHRDNQPRQHGRIEGSPRSPENLNRRLSRSPDGLVDNAVKCELDVMDDNGNPALPEDNLRPSDSPDRYRKVRKRDMLVDPSTKFKQYGFIDSPELFSAKEPHSAPLSVGFIPDIGKQTKSKSTGSVAAKLSDHEGHGPSVDHARSDPKDSHERSHSAERAPVRWVPGLNRRPMSLAEPGRQGGVSGVSCRRTRRNSYRRRSTRRKSRQSVSFDQPDSIAHNRDSNNPISSRRSRSLERKGSPASKREDSPATMVIRPGGDPGNGSSERDGVGDSII
ncbi:uncharacterized protein LOC135499918 [Lineus longissimus]|uniref:uncharacterized protein LOC135499918 n=1 Tax=Lineus longissimus TaxID=88925 RepID=UPI002B4E2981